jgi:transposase
VLNAIRYMARSAGGWRMLPVHFGPWQTAYCWFRRFVRRLLFRTIQDMALMLYSHRFATHKHVFCSPFRVTGTLSQPL